MPRIVSKMCVYELTILPGANFVEYARLQIYKQTARHILATAGLAEERAKRVVRVLHIGI